MMRPPRGLSADEAALWARVAGTVTPLGRGHAKTAANPIPALEEAENLSAKALEKPIPFKGGGGVRAATSNKASQRSLPPATLDRHGLDTSWERKLDKAAIAPDFTLDLHGHSLDAAHGRLDHGLALAVAQQARLVLVITGRSRPVAAADRGERRGAIRAKLLDWLAVGPHASRIAAVRPAHQKHGGAGALYVVLRRHR